LICAPFAHTVFFVDHLSARAYCTATRRVADEPLLPLASVGRGGGGGGGGGFGGGMVCTALHVAFGELLLLGGMSIGVNAATICRHCAATVL
jgi:hypothetical protein